MLVDNEQTNEDTKTEDPSLAPSTKSTVTTAMQKKLPRQRGAAAALQA